MIGTWKRSHPPLKGPAKAGMGARWPDFFVVGAAKAGTTALFQELASHPDVFVPRVKEPHFFSGVKPARRQRHIVTSIGDETAYLRLFADAEPRQRVGEASTSYLWAPEAPRRILTAVPDARIIAILRDPIDRAFSHYLMDVREGVQRHPFMNALAEDQATGDKGWGRSHLYLELGHYGEQLRRYVGVFGADRVLVLGFDEFCQERERTIDRTLRFLGLDPRARRRRELTAADRNAFAAPRGRMAAAMLGSPFMRGLGRLAGRRLRNTVRDALLDRRAPRPQMNQDAWAFLMTEYAADLKELRSVLGPRFDSVAARWPSVQGASVEDQALDHSTTDAGLRD